MNRLMQWLKGPVLDFLGAISLPFMIVTLPLSSFLFLALWFHVDRIIALIESPFLDTQITLIVLRFGVFVTIAVTFAAYIFGSIELFFRVSYRENDVNRR